jgi:hypothetical protein
MVAKSKGKVSRPALTIGQRVVFRWEESKSRGGGVGGLTPTDTRNRPRLEHLQERVGTVVDVDIRAVRRGASIYEVDVEFDDPVPTPNGFRLKVVGGLSSDHLELLT